MLKTDLLNLAIRYAESNSDDKSTKVGAALAVNNDIVLGANRFKSQLPEGHSIDSLNLKENRPLKLQYITHAEVDAIENNGGAANGATIVVNYCPCINCATKIISAGIKHVVIQYRYETPDSYWYADHQTAKQMFVDNGLIVEEINPQ